MAQCEKSHAVYLHQEMGFYLYGLFCRYRHEVAHSNGKLFVFGGGRATLVYTFEKVLIILVNHFFLRRPLDMGCKPLWLIRFCCGSSYTGFLATCI